MGLINLTTKVLGSDTYNERKVLATDLNQIKGALQSGTYDIKPDGIQMEGNTITADAGQNWIRRNNNTFEFYSAGAWREPTTETILGFVAGEDLDVRDVVYIKPSDGKVYKCYIPRYVDWIGLTKTSATTGNNVEVYNNNSTVGGFTGLEKGEWYGLTTTPGTLAKSDDNLVGIAIDNTQMVLFKSPPDSTQDDLINVNSKIFCELLNNGDINASSIDKIISNSGLSGVTNTPSTTWSSKLTNFSSLVGFNDNKNQVNDGIIELAYFNTSGNLIAGRFNLLTDTFTQTHSIASGDLPTTTGDTTYNASPHTQQTLFMLTESNTLIYCMVTEWENEVPSPDEVALFVDAKVYNSSSVTIQTYESRVDIATSGNGHNGFDTYDNIGFYTSGNVAKAICCVIKEENDTDYDDIEYRNLQLTYDSTFSAALTGYIYYVGDDYANIHVTPLVVLNDYLYVKYEGIEDDGGSVDEYNIEGYLLKFHLTDFSKTILDSFSEYSCESPDYDAYSVGDMIYTTGQEEQNGGDETCRQCLFVNGSSVYAHEESDPDVDLHCTWLQLPEGYEISIDLQENNITKHSLYKAYNRLENTSSNITAFSTVGSSDLTTENYSGSGKDFYIFEETTGTRHFADITSTYYRVYDKIIGEVNFNDDITDTYMDKVFTYYTPFINTFWSNLIDNIDTNVTVNNGVDDTVLNANEWDYYGDTVEEIDLTINCDIGVIQGTGNLSYYMLYD